MICKKYSQEQLESEAEQLLEKFDPTLLSVPKIFDVYSVIEKCLGVDYSWQYIRPDQKILGLTAFRDGYVWVSPTPYFYDGITPIKINLSKGEIVIERTLTENSNSGRENFTVMHEVFHQVIHKDIFCNATGEFIHETTASALSGTNHRLKTNLDFIEYQANACAAAFLMPRKTVPSIWRRISGYDYPVSERFVRSQTIQDIAERYQVSKQAMQYRLFHLGLIKPETNYQHFQFNSRVREF